MIVTLSEQAMGTLLAANSAEQTNIADAAFEAMKQWLADPARMSRDAFLLRRAELQQGVDQVASRALSALLRLLEHCRTPQINCEAFRHHERMRRRTHHQTSTP
jgi:hypothetical protein